MAGTLTILEAVLMKKHSFSVEFAERFGIVEALLIDYFFSGLTTARRRRKKTNTSTDGIGCMAAFARLQKLIRICLSLRFIDALKKLEEAGAIKTDAFNKLTIGIKTYNGIR